MTRLEAYEHAARLIPLPAFSADPTTRLCARLALATWLIGEPGEGDECQPPLPFFHAPSLVDYDDLPEAPESTDDDPVVKF